MNCAKTIWLFSRDMALSNLQKSTGLNDVSSETGNNHVSESSDSDSLDVDQSDAIISGYSKTVLSKPDEQKTGLSFIQRHTKTTLDR